jgi:hypothetical protein
LSGFSEDGQWWWDGQAWIATSQVALPQLPTTEFEQAGKLNKARSRMRTGMGLLSANFVVANLLGGTRLAPLIELPMWLPGLVLERRAFHDYRTWTLEQLALTTSYLLGSDEPMLAGETTMFGSFWWNTIKRDLAVVVTAAHVLVLRIDFVNGQARYVALAARPRDVKIYFSNALFGIQPTLVVVCGSWQWAIRGQVRVFQPEPVLQAWRQASPGAVPKTA